MSLLDAAVLGMATWRLSSLLSRERGPLGLLVWVRSLAGIEPMADGDPEPGTWPADGELAQLIVCPWCLSLWIGALALAAYLWLGAVAVYLCLPFALSAAAIIIERLVR